MKRAASSPPRKQPLSRSRSCRLASGPGARSRGRRRRRPEGETGVGEHLDPPGQVAEDARRLGHHRRGLPKIPTAGPLWTDDYSSLFQVLRVRPLPTLVGPLPPRSPPRPRPSRLTPFGGVRLPPRSSSAILFPGLRPRFLRAPLPEEEGADILLHQQPWDSSLGSPRTARCSIAEVAIGQRVDKLFHYAVPSHQAASLHRPPRRRAVRQGPARRVRRGARPGNRRSRPEGDRIGAGRTGRRLRRPPRPRQMGGRLLRRAARSRPQDHSSSRILRSGKGLYKEKQEIRVALAPNAPAARRRLTAKQEAVLALLQDFGGEMPLTALPRGRRVGRRRGRPGEERDSSRSRKGRPPGSRIGHGRAGHGDRPLGGAKEGRRGDRREPSGRNVRSVPSPTASRGAERPRSIYASSGDRQGGRRCARPRSGDRAHAPTHRPVRPTARRRRCRPPFRPHGRGAQGPVEAAAIRRGPRSRGRAVGRLRARGSAEADRRGRRARSVLPAGRRRSVSRPGHGRDAGQAGGNPRRPQDGDAIARNVPQRPRRPLPAARSSRAGRGSRFPDRPNRRLEGAKSGNRFLSRTSSRRSKRLAEASSLFSF